MIVFVNGEAREVAAPVTVSELVQAGRGVAVAVDGAVIPRAKHAETEVAEGSRVEIVTAVQGG